MIIRMDESILPSSSACEFEGSVCEHFIHIHMGGCAHTCLEGINNEVFIMEASDHLLSRSDNKVCTLPVEFSELMISLCCRDLEFRDRMEELYRQCSAGNREILFSSLGVNTIQCFRRNLLRAQRVFLLARPHKLHRGKNVFKCTFYILVRRSKIMRHECQIKETKKGTTFTAILRFGKKKVTFKMPFSKKDRKLYEKDYRAYVSKSKDKKFPHYERDHVPCVAFYFLKELMAQVLSPYEHLMKHKLTINLKPVHVKGHREIMAYYPSKSSPRNVDVTISWYFLIDTIIEPYYKNKPLLIQELSSTILHEFVGHFGDQLSGLDKQQARIEAEIDKMENVKLRMLNTAFFDLRAEGFANFQGLQQAEEVRLHMGWVRHFQRHLRAMLRRRTAPSMDRYYQKHLYVDEGVYHAGMIMCLTIALAIAKKKRVEIGRFPPLPINWWLWLPWTKMYQIPRRVFKAAVKEILPLTVPNKFISRYHQACDYLRIKDAHRVISEAFFYELVDKATGMEHALHEACENCPDFIEEYIHG